MTDDDKAEIATLIREYRRLRALAIDSGSPTKPFLAAKRALCRRLTGHGPVCLDGEIYLGRLAGLVVIDLAAVEDLRPKGEAT